jgi:hypothetical protein
MSPATTRTVTTTANPRDLLVMMRERVCTGTERSMATADKRLPVALLALPVSYSSAYLEEMSFVVSTDFGGSPILCVAAHCLKDIKGIASLK